MTQGHPSFVLRKLPGLTPHRKCRVRHEVACVCWEVGRDGECGPRRLGLASFRLRKFRPKPTGAASRRQVWLRGHRCLGELQTVKGCGGLGISARSEASMTLQGAQQCRVGLLGMCSQWPMKKYRGLLTRPKEATAWGRQRGDHDKGVGMVAMRNLRAVVLRNSLCLGEANSRRARGARSVFDSRILRGDR